MDGSVDQRNQEGDEAADDPDQGKQEISFRRESSFKDALKAGVLEDLHVGRGLEWLAPADSRSSNGNESKQRVWLEASSVFDEMGE